MHSIDDYASDAENQWCPGCPNFGILEALKKALVELEKTPDQVCLVSGIGQAAKLPHYLKCNFFNGLHGRPHTGGYRRSVRQSESDHIRCYRGRGLLRRRGESFSACPSKKPEYHGDGP